MQQDERYRMLRIWTETNRTLRKIAAFTDETIIEVIDRLANEEWQRVQQEEGGRYAEEVPDKDVA